jgi:hypothetical protein
LTQYASFLGVPIADLEVRAQLFWDNRRKHGVGDLPQAALGFTFRVAVSTDAPEARVREVFERAEEACYASDTLRNAVPMRAHLALNGREIAVQRRGGEIPAVEIDAD